METRRVVVTGMGVLTSNGHGLQEFEKALRESRSGIRFLSRLEELNFACKLGGIPQGYQEKSKDYFSAEDLLAMNQAMIFAGISSIDAWKDAGLEVPSLDSEPAWDTGLIIGAGLGGMDTIAEKLVPRVNAGKVRRLGSTMVEQSMTSSVSAKVTGLLGLGNQVTTNSSACNTGTEAIIDGYYRIKFGLAEKMLVGGVESHSEYIWSGFDAMKVLNTKSNDHPEKASRPMSASAGGFIPGSGGGMLYLETLESAQKRGARIYAEVLGGSLNCGGHRMGGSMTAPNPISVQRNIQAAMSMANIKSSDIDYINGHLTATFADPVEVKNWATALQVTPENLPLINSTKSLIGHGLGAAGSVESVATVLQLHKGFVHKSANCEDLHEDLIPYQKSVVRETVDKEINIAAKASFGFGDVNGTVIYKRWTNG